MAKHILKVHGPNLGSENSFTQGYDNYLLDHPSQAEIDQGYLIVKLPASPGRPEVTDPRRPSVVIPGRKPTGPKTITYAPGQWSKTTVFEQLEED